MLNFIDNKLSLQINNNFACFPDYKLIMSLPLSYFLAYKVNCSLLTPVHSTELFKLYFNSSDACLVKQRDH